MRKFSNSLLFLTTGAIVALLIVVFAITFWYRQGTMRQTQTLLPLSTQSHPGPIPQPTPTAEITQRPSVEVKIHVDWKAYENKRLGFALRYPENWFLYDQNIWERDSKGKPCFEGDYIGASVILSKKDLGRCVGNPTREGMIGDFIVYIDDKELPLDSPNFFSEDLSTMKKIKIDGVSALKSFFSDHSGLPRNKSVEIYLNHQGKGYTIEFIQNDKKGNYDPVFDEIISTFKFTK